MHLDQPGGRPSNQNHIRGCFTIFRATQLLKQDVDGEENRGRDEGLISLHESEKFLKKRYVNSMIPVRVRQDQTYPPFMKECKQLQVK